LVGVNTPHQSADRRPAPTVSIRTSDKTDEETTISQRRYLPVPLTELDASIGAALATIGSNSQFSQAAYIKAFSDSAVEKARTVIEKLEAPNAPFQGQKPVFVSIGGGDGTELRELLTCSSATNGLLIEKSTDVVKLARKHDAPTGKSIEIYHGDAIQQLSSAMARARQIVADGAADFVAVTCHAVLHELYDRAAEPFNPLSLFATIFGDEQAPSTWFTYREPGAPEKWPDAVLLRAKCTPSSLLKLAEAICHRHPILSSRKPAPCVVGDHVLLHRDLAMETLAKLFYLEDLSYEIEERSTAVNHQELMSYALLAIGQSAINDRCGDVQSISEATRSFARLWQEYGVNLRSAPPGNLADLPIPESQTRVTAWRQRARTRKNVSAESGAPKPEVGQSLMEIELEMARRAFATSDEQMLVGLLASRARSWIESDVLPKATSLLTQIRNARTESDLAYLWSSYILNIAELFAGKEVSPDVFAGPVADHATDQGLGLLFAAEFMELNRKSRDYDRAISAANTTLDYLRNSSRDETAEGRYCRGTANYLLANLLRHGGQYEQARPFIGEAETLFVRGIPSHDTELAHCRYAKSVCALMTGTIDITSDGRSDHSVGQDFANALISLTYSHAAWFTSNAVEAKRHAQDAEEQFQRVGFHHYAERAKTLHSLLNIWALFEAGKPVKDVSATPAERFVALITGQRTDLTEIERYLPVLKPSVLVGLLQFARKFSDRFDQEVSISLPGMWALDDHGQIRKQPGGSAKSMSEADSKLRALMGIAHDRRVPLLAD
jgi:tetratricopeptide (TPR) repeat protein